MKSKFYTQITFKIFLALLIGFEVGIQIMTIGGKLLTLIFNGEPESIVFFITTIIIMFILPFIAFIVTILLLVRKRLKYFTYIIHCLKNIGDNELLNPLEVKGKDEFAILAQSINLMSSRIKNRYENEKKIEASKNELISNMAHDLKSPLTSILGYMELLCENKFEDEKTRKRYEEIVYSKSLHLKYMVNSLFEYTKLMDGNIQLSKEETEISTLLLQSLGEGMLKFESKDIQVNTDKIGENIFLSIDPKQMVRVFDNLIENAYKYGEETSTLQVSLQEYDNLVHISFKNRTSLLTKEDTEKIFEKSYRADKSRNSENEGSGFGLAICKRIIELHNGDINAEYDGSTIEFKIILSKE